MIQILADVTTGIRPYARCHVRQDLNHLNVTRCEFRTLGSNNTNKQVHKLSVSERAKWYDVKKVDVNSGAKHSNAKKMVLENRKRKVEAESSSEESEEDA